MQTKVAITQAPVSQAQDLAALIIGLVLVDLEVPIMVLVQNLEVLIMSLVQVRVPEVPVLGLILDQVQVV